jgi:hypothetical protein
MPLFGERANEVIAALDLTRIVKVSRAQLHTERWRHRLDRAPLARPGGDGGIAQDCNPRHGGRNLLEQFQPFRA